MADEPPNDRDDGPVPISFTAPLNAGPTARPPAAPPAPPPESAPASPEPEPEPEREREPTPEDAGRPLLRAVPGPQSERDSEPVEIEEHPWASPMQALAALPDPALADSPVTADDDGRDQDLGGDGSGEQLLPPAAENGEQRERGGAGALAMAAGLAVSVAALRGLERERDSKRKDERGGRAGPGAGGPGAQRRSGGISGAGGGTGGGTGSSGGLSARRTDTSRTGQGTGSGGGGALGGGRGGDRRGPGTRGGGSDDRPGPLRSTHQSAGVGTLGNRTGNRGGGGYGTGGWGSGGAPHRGGGTSGGGRGRTGPGKSLGRDGTGRAVAHPEHRRSDVTPLVHRDRRPGGTGGTGGGTDRKTAPTKSRGRSGRTTLAQALGEDATRRTEPRLTRRRAGMRPPIWRREDHHKKKEKEGGKPTAGGAAPAPGTGGTSSAGPGARPPLTPGASTSHKTRAGRTKTKPGAPDPQSKSKSKRRSKGKGRRGRTGNNSSWWRPRGWSKARERVRSRARPAAGGEPFDDDGGNFWTGTSTGTGSSGPRQTPWESAAEATHDHDTTVWRADKPPPPGHTQEQITTGVRMLGPAPTPHHPRPVTTAPHATHTSTKETDVPNPRTRTGALAVSPSGAYQPAVGSSGHDTDVKLGDALRHLKKLTKASWAAYRQFEWAADGALKLRAAMLDLAELLAQRNNVIGRRTRAALARLAESMDRLARAATRAKDATLASAEMTEALARDMEAAYRPMQQITADKGLATPSARTHNQP
ncbi:hypothetical protein GCM10023347_07690 [Streptomyces chumphonensis]|uniref:Uncharacterized protein n=1 Tax=Streptomyces chumphonensis TaxID=1214925 RepID=A0A927F438_9ACTN|nr:hypothetical protein [Streptomyces chumphonensis]MBD3934841.1 hypothetical protein [Streptomyces chumphonensis]